MRIIILSILTILLVSVLNVNCQTDFKTFYDNFVEEKLHSDHSPIPEKKRKKLDSIPWFNYDSSFQISCAFEPYDFDTIIQLGTSDDRPRSYYLIGKIKFEIEGSKFELSAFKPVKKLEKDKLWVLVPFFDKTSGIESYGGGRYIDYKWANFENIFLSKNPVIDFNFAYNPYCAYSNGYSCPTPPRENFIDFKIEAGEKAFK